MREYIDREWVRGKRNCEPHTATANDGAPLSVANAGY